MLSDCETAGTPPPSASLFCSRYLESCCASTWRLVVSQTTAAVGMLTGSLCALIGLSWLALHWCQQVPHVHLDPWQSAVPWSMCLNETGAGSPRHELFLNKLSGRRVVFVGDCILRFQYLELAYYLIHGSCPDRSMLSGKQGGFNDLLSRTTAALNTFTPSQHAQEFVIGGRYKDWMVPLFTTEHRVFTFHDSQDRQMELMYINYYTEQYGTLGLSLKMADILRPTDVIVNFGVWLNDKPANTTCGDTLRPWHHMGKCPYMHEVCEYFMAPEHKHPFNLWWATTTPGLERSGRKRVVVPKVPLGHNLNAESACGLPPDMVLDRVAMLNRVQPDKSKQPALYDDGVHFSSPDVYHAFNWMLLSRLPELPEGEAEQTPYPTLSTHLEQHPGVVSAEYEDGHMHAPPLRFIDVSDVQHPWDDSLQIDVIEESHVETRTESDSHVELLLN